MKIFPAIITILLLAACSKEIAPEKVILKKETPYQNTSVTRNLGEFQLTSPKVILGDPGNAPSQMLSECEPGTWSASLTTVTPKTVGFPIPWKLTATHLKTKDQILSPLNLTISSDSAIIGIYDSTHFRDISIIPKEKLEHLARNSADPGDLWYSFVCSLVDPPVDGVVIPFGVVIHWDGGAEVFVGRDASGKIQMIQFEVNVAAYE